MAKIKKLGLTINCFDSSELLFDLISQIRDQVDWVAGFYQKRSYWKNAMDPVDMTELNRLKGIGLIDELVEFKPNWLKPSREQETDKRNQGIGLAKERGCSHILNIDADEYYEHDQLKLAKEIINEKGWTSTYWSYVNYFRDLEHYLVYPFRPFVPGIHSTFFTYTFNGPAPGPTDPTRRILNPLNIGTYVFEDNEIRMQHLAWVRKNIRKKLENWSAKDHFDQNLINKAVKQFENWKEGDPAIMLFNVPENSVYVKKLETRITGIQIPWVEAEMERWKAKQIEDAKKEAK